MAHERIRDWNGPIKYDTTREVLARRDKEIEYEGQEIQKKWGLFVSGESEQYTSGEVTMPDGSKIGVNDVEDFKRSYAAVCKEVARFSHGMVSAGKIGYGSLEDMSESSIVFLKSPYFGELEDLEKLAIEQRKTVVCVYAQHGSGREDRMKWFQRFEHNEDNVLYKRGRQSEISIPSGRDMSSIGDGPDYGADSDF